jgi:hypothetical protein
MPPPVPVPHNRAHMNASGWNDRRCLVGKVVSSSVRVRSCPFDRPGALVAATSFVPADSKWTADDV